MCRQTHAFSKLFVCACVTMFLGAAGCSGDDDSGDDMGVAGNPPSGSGGVIGGTGGKPAAMSSGGTTGSGGTSTGKGTGGATTPAGDTGTQCAAQSCGGLCCGAVCVDEPDSDETNCGVCGKVCKSSETCTGGLCAEKERECDLSDEDAGRAEQPNKNGCYDNEECLSIDGAPATCRCGTTPGCPANEACSKDGKCMCGKNAGCATGSGCCDGKCFDVQTDEDNCGECGKQCADGLTCTAGDCRCPNLNDTACGDDCVDTNTDEDNCGKCGKECAVGATCVSGTCRCDVQNRVACDGRCVAINTNTNCGKCGNDCEAPSTCQDPSGSRPLGCYCPNFNQVACNGSCVTLGTVDNCGKCGDTCDGVADTCRDGSCQCADAAKTACDDGCFNLNTGVDADPGTGAGQILMENCGKCGVTCLPGAACTNGVCACPSPSTTDVYCDQDKVTGKKDGHYACIDVTTIVNCGGCGNGCLGDSECRGTNGSDAPGDFSCVCIGDDAGKTHCPGLGCKNLTNDESSCGTCGVVCPDNINCVSRKCQCPSGQEVCEVDNEPKCVDTESDEDNCGECGTVCGSNEECCGGECVDPDNAFDNDLSNCGSCGYNCRDHNCGFLGIGCSCNNGTCN
jgi:hypothetical protein